ncbi:MAG: ChbG/HpnK family deacetylase, partial [Planctomycetales bacterium]|nr:ChbG/HpnK family deacetylase [Planctomycetales bacterium]
QLSDGFATSASAVVPGTWFTEFAEWCRSHPGHDVGVALALNSEMPYNRYGPVAPRSEVASLVDADGYLAATTLQSVINADAGEVERELRAQIERALKSGVKPGHLSPHLGTLVARADLMDVYLRLAREYWIPAVMVELTDAHIEQFRSEGFPLDEATVRAVREYPLPKLDHIEFIPTADSYEAKRERFMELARSLRPGITQITYSPTVKSMAVERLWPQWQQYVWDAQLIADPEVRTFLVDEGFVLTDWIEMMQRFEQGGPSLEMPTDDAPDAVTFEQSDSSGASP